MPDCSFPAATGNTALCPAAFASLLRTALLATGLTAALAGCAVYEDLPPFPAPGDAAATTLHTAAPDGATEAGEAPGGLCWASDVVTQGPRGAQAIFARPGLIPAQRGKGEELWFQVPCPGEGVEDFTASLQRALQARGLYGGAIDGRDGPALQAAVRAYQAPLGLNSGTLSLAAARTLGLVAIERPE